MKKIGFLLFLILATSCAGIRVNYDYEPQTDWSTYQTYAFYPQMETGMTDLDTRRLTSALEDVLREKGYRQGEDADLLLNIFSQMYQEAPGGNVGVGLGGTGGNVGGGVSVGIPMSGSGLKREITFDLIDATRDQLIWQAVSIDSFRENESPRKREERFQALVRKVFSNFPPENQ